MSNDIEIKKQEQETFNTKFMRELQEVYSAYFYTIITEIFVGVSVNLGIPEAEAYKLAKNNPQKLEKAFFSDIFKRFQKVFKRKVRKFRYSKRKLFSKETKPLTPEQWDQFNKNISEYWKEHARSASEAMGVQSFLLGRVEQDYQVKKKPYENKSLEQVQKEQFPDGMPESIAEAYKRYKFNKTEKQIIQRTQSAIAQYVTKTNNNLQEAIRNNIVEGMNEGRSANEIASNLYWETKENPNKYTADAVRKNWRRIAETEMADVKNQGYMSAYEDQAVKSLKDPKRAVYMVRRGGTCDFCKPRQGTIYRLIPSSLANPDTDKLSAIGIKDTNTDLYTYIGASNVGKPKAQWSGAAVPAHPFNKATLEYIDLKTQYYNPDTGDIERKKIKGLYEPDIKQVSEDKRAEEKKPKKIADNRYHMNGNVYNVVSKSDYNQALEESRKDASKPIPISEGSPAHRRLLAALENQ